MSYKAIVTPLTNVRKHPNADRLNLATVVGSQVVVGLHHVDGELGVYFPPDGQLSHEMCVANGLYNKSALEELGLDAASFVPGFFDIKRRVRAQKFRGEVSDGLWLPLECLSWWSNDPWKAGDVICEDPKICIKYITKATRQHGQGNKVRAVKRGEALGFPKHYDTEQFAYNYQDIPDGSIIYLTEKLHGTSGRYGLVREEFQYKHWWEKPFKWIHDFIGMPLICWNYLNGSRMVVLEHTEGAGYYGTNDFRTNAVKNLSLRKGEVIFFELVGDVAPGSPIMPHVIVPKELDDTKKQYGDTIRYRYGCENGECRLYVYRIVQFNEDGQGVELSWPQVKRRCREIGVNWVPELAGPQIIYASMDTEPWDRLKNQVEQLAKGPSVIDDSHIREGVVVRVETPDGRVYSLKHKSFVFKVLEGLVKLDDNYVDMEESS